MLLLSLSRRAGNIGGNRAGPFLLIPPRGLGIDTVNIHRLYIGQTATLAGVIFCAAAWRPR
jgi:hypothetical protein